MVEGARDVDLSPEDFDIIRDYIHRVSGIAFNREKMYLIQQRLEPLVRAAGCKDFSELSRKLVHDDSVGLRNDVILSITTNETSFFRDVHPFEAFRTTILPELADRIRRRKAAFPGGGSPTKAHILSTGASTGQEPYSIAMLVHEFTAGRPGSDLAPDDFNILATDISKKVLQKAMAGEYTKSEVDRGLSEKRQAAFFTESGKIWRLRDAIRNRVRWHQLNIIEPYAIFGIKCDVIFCRNMMIYFDDATKRRVFDTLFRLLTDEGYLFLGAMESTYMLTDKFESVRMGETLVYRKRKTG